MDPILLLATSLMTVSVLYLNFAKAGGGKGGAAIEKLWQKRDEDGNAEKLVEELAKLAAAEPKNYDAHWQLARACWWRCSSIRAVG